MKKIHTLIALIICVSFYAQVPLGFSYQTTVRNNAGSLIANQNVNFKFNILQNSSTGMLVYSETQNATTDNFGYVSLVVGQGIPSTGSLAGINWGNAAYYMGVELDTGIGFTVMGNKQLLSVPFALYAGNSDYSTNPGGFKHYLGELYNGGIIFEIYKGSDNLEHGLIVSLTEIIGQWQSVGSLVSANRNYDGAYNTALMANSPAKVYIESLGVGWYLPSRDELCKLYYNRFYVNKALSLGGNILLSNKASYWSSSEYGTLSAFLFDFGLAEQSYTLKTITNNVRGVKSF